MMKSCFPEGKEPAEGVRLRSSRLVLRKNPAKKFMFVWVFCSLSVLGGTSCWGEPLSIDSLSLNVDLGVRLIGLGGTLVYRGGVDLTSRDRRFGGFSGLLVSQNGERMLAVSDRGWWLRGNLLYNEYGDLVGVQDADILPMRLLEGSPNITLDAEAVVQNGESGYIVAYERQHRIWSYHDVWSSPKPVTMGNVLSFLPFNSGIESLALMAPGELLAITESGSEGSGFVAFYKTEDGVTQVQYPYDRYFRPSDAVGISENSLLVLERGYNRKMGVAARLVLAQLLRVDGKFKLTRDTLVNLDRPIPLDNFEGLAITSSPASPTTIYLLSDNNFNKDQRTLLMMFDLEIWR